MDNQFMDELLSQYPDLVEILDYYMFVSKEVFESRYRSYDSNYLNYNLLYDLITTERGYSYVYTLFCDLLITGDSLSVGYVENGEIYSIEVTRAKLARSIKRYQEVGKLNFEGIYKERIDDILAKTSYQQFLETYHDEDFHVIIDGDDITMKAHHLVEFITLPSQKFENFFKKKDEYYKGIPKSYFAYMTNSFFLNISAFDDYIFPNEVYMRSDLLKNNQLIDIEALNKVKKTLDNTVDRIKVNEELKDAVLKNLDTSLSSLEQAIYIYIKLCKLLSYDDEFYAVNQRGYVALKHENPDSVYKITPTNNKAVCYEFNAIFAKFLQQLNIKFETTSRLNGFYKGHTSLMFRVGKFLVNADSVESILKCDLVSAKMNNPLDGLRCINKNEETRDEFADTLSHVYLMIAAEEHKEEKVEEVETFEDILHEYEGCVEENLDLDSKLSIMLDKVIHAGMQSVDSIAYLLQLRKIIFTKEERERNIKISIVRDNVTVPKERLATISAIFTINKDNMYADIFENEYYFFHPNYPLVPVSIIEIEELFRGKLLEYIGDKYLEIPGLSIKEESIDDREIKEVK